MSNSVVRVLHVLHSLSCGGAEMMIMNLYRNIDRSKIQFDFMLHSSVKGVFEEEVLSYGGRIFRVPYFNGFNSFKYSHAVRDLLISHPEISVIHGHLGSCAHIYLNEARKLGRFTIAHSHNTNPKNVSIKNIAYRFFTLKTRKIADYYFACSQKAGLDRFGKRIVEDKSKYKVFYNAIDCLKYSFNPNTREKMRDELCINDRYVLGHVGRFNEQKNHEYLVSLFNEYHNINTDSILVLVGDGELRSAIQNKVEDLHLSNSVRFLGLRNDVDKLLQAFDCMVFPSKYEGLPTTIVEAQAAGLPCIISDTITNEVILSNLVNQVPLSNDYSEWIKYIDDCKSVQRTNRQEELKTSGYDISDTSNWLMDFYISHSST